LRYRFKDITGSFHAGGVLPEATALCQLSRKRVMPKRVLKRQMISARRQRISYKCLSMLHASKTVATNVLRFLCGRWKI